MEGGKEGVKKMGSRKWETNQWRHHDWRRAGCSRQSARKTLARRAPPLEQRPPYLASPMSIWIHDVSSGRCSRHVNDSLRSDGLVTRPTTVRAASWQPGSRNRNCRALPYNRVLPTFLLSPCPFEDRMMKRQRLTRAAARV